MMTCPMYASHVCVRAHLTLEERCSAQADKRIVAHSCKPFVACPGLHKACVTAVQFVASARQKVQHGPMYRVRAMQWLCCSQTLSALHAALSQAASLFPEFALAGLSPCFQICIFHNLRHNTVQLLA